MLPTRRTSVPHRSPGAPGHEGNYLGGKVITYYRPRGSAEVRQLIDNGFQAFNAGRLSEACQIFSEKMLAPDNDTTVALTIAGALTPAGLGGCIIEMMERGLVDFIISTGANLYHDLHYALNFSLHRGSPFLDDVELYEQGIIRIYDVLFPATVLLETDAYIRDFLVRSRAPEGEPLARCRRPSSTIGWAWTCSNGVPGARSTRSSRMRPNQASRSIRRRQATVLSA